MDGGARVRVVESRGDGLEQLDHSKGVVLVALVQGVVQSLARDDLSHEVRAVALVGQLVEARDGRVLEGHVGAQLEQETAGVRHVPCRGGADGAHRHFLVQAGMLRFVEGAQAVLIDLSQDPVGPEAGSGLGYRHEPGSISPRTRSLRREFAGTPTCVCALTPSVIETVTLGHQPRPGASKRAKTAGVSARGIEPPSPFGHQILNLARLPFRHADTTWTVTAVALADGG